MKRLIIVLGILLIASTARAEQLTFDTTATATRNWVNNSLSILYNRGNTGWETDNIANGAITSDDIATAANPLVRDAENIGEYVYTGLLPPTSTDLDATTTAGTAYVENDGDDTLHRVVKSATAKTYTDSVDTYVFLDFTGKYTYTEVATGATQPSTPANNIILAKVVSDGDNVTSVTDLRQTTPPNLRVYQDLKSGCVISRDVSDADKVSIDVGELEFGTTVTSGRRRNTAPAYVDFAESGEGGLDTGSQAASTYYAIWAYPEPDDSTSFVAAGSLSFSDLGDISGTTNDDVARVIGWCYSDASTNISADSVGAIRKLGGDAPNIVSRTVSADASDTTTSEIFTNISGTDLKFYSSGRPVLIQGWARMGSSSDIVVELILSIDGAEIPQTRCAIEAGDNSDTVDYARVSPSFTYLTTLNEGEHDLQLMFRTNTGTTYVFNRTLIVQEL